MGEKKHINKTPPKNPGTIRVFFFMCFFPLPKKPKGYENGWFSKWQVS